ncbi:YqcC family protein [Zophobihabitans entericus]
MRKTSLWQTSAPEPSAFESVEPFCVDRMHAHEWLQWIFLPRMKALIDMRAELPTNFALHPYFEEAFKEQDEHNKLLELIKQLDELSQN